MSKGASLISKQNAGNTEGRIAMRRAMANEQERGKWPYVRGGSGKANSRLPKYQDQLVLPPADMQGPELERFLRQWGEYGAGRGRYANGGRAKRIGRALRRAGGVTVGAVAGKTGGRADALDVSVPAGSYVIPADVVAALGEGNSAAGLAKLGKQFPARRANGGRAGAVPIKISDGEFVVSPDAIRALGGGDETYGHEILDAFVLNTRKAHIEHLNNLPGPNQ